MWYEDAEALVIEKMRELGYPVSPYALGFEIPHRVLALKTQRINGILIDLARKGVVRPTGRWNQYELC